MNFKKYTVVIADDHPFVLAGVKDFLKDIGFIKIEAFSSGIAALNYILRNNVNLTVLDFNMPDMNGIEILKSIKLKKLKTKTIILTMHNQESIVNACIKEGADGYLLKDMATKDLLNCITEILNGNKYISKELLQNINNDQQQQNPLLKQLTDSEYKVLKLITLNKSTKEIASMLFCAEKTIEKHRTNIIVKLNLAKQKNSLKEWAEINSHLLGITK